jgi:hypothetical protein
VIRFVEAGEVAIIALVAAGGDITAEFMQPGRSDEFARIFGAPEQPDDGQIPADGKAENRP